jgi:hypothetical protein
MGKKVRVTRIVDVTEMGRAGGHARAASLSEAELSAAGSKAIAARWDKYYKLHPEKLKAKLERQENSVRAGKAGKKKAAKP